MLGDIKRHLRSQVPELPQDSESISLQPSSVKEGAQDIAIIYTMLKKISDDMGGIEEICRTTASVESKLSALITRIDDVEKRVEFLEEKEKDWQANLPATKCDLDQLREKVEDMENRSRRNNLRFIGISEGKESGNMIKFMGELISTFVDASEQWIEIERAHRVFGPRPNPEDRPRPIQVRFLKSMDRDSVLRAAREKGEIHFEGRRIQVFPDFARTTQLKRDKFRECRKSFMLVG